MNWLRSILLPAAGSSYARQVDDLYIFILLVCVFFFVLVAGLLSFFVWRYRRRGPEESTPHITHHFKLELLWSIAPLLLLMVIFFWGFNSYIDGRVAPGNSLEIQVTARKWLWQFEYPDGTRTINELHVPVGQPVKLIMVSEDVIHSFFVPSFRVKMDVLPNRYTELWFQPEQEGVHALMCAEYCGLSHSDMTGQIYVDSPEAYAEWRERGDEVARTMPLAELGLILYESRGCATCHSLDGSRGEGPSFQGVFGGVHRMDDGTPVKVDENYLRQSILEPQADVVAGFQGIMPTFQGLLRDREISALIEFIKTQQ